MSAYAACLWTLIYLDDAALFLWAFKAWVVFTGLGCFAGIFLAFEPRTK